MSKHDFSLIPSVSFRRSKFSMNHGVKTSFNVGELVPLNVLEVIPGDTFDTTMTAVIRTTSSFVRPIMDNLFMDVYHFFVPYRLVYENAEKVFGVANPSMYVDGQLDSFPTFEDKINISSKSVGDYLNLPVGELPSGISVLPFRAFALIYNQWFRNQSIIDETYVQKGAIAQSEVPNNNAWSPNNYTGKLPHVGKRKDYFTSALPKPQKGEPVSLPLYASAPVTVRGSKFFKAGEDSDSTLYGYISPRNSDGSPVTLGSGESGRAWMYSNSNGLTGTLSLLSTGTVDLSEAVAADVNDLRFAFQLQKMLERDSLYGSRYNEFLLAHFGVSSPDSRLQLPEYLGGGRIPIQIYQVAQTSQGEDDNALASVAGLSLSNGKSRFVKGFVEHGFVMTVGCVRQIHTYQQGIPKMYMRSSRNDFYDPLFANLGEQPIYESEIFGTVDELKGNVLGYNEAWADYRYVPNKVTGQMRTDASSSLDRWHLADYYANAPVLSEAFVNENAVNIDRSLNVPSDSQDNFIADLWFETSAIRVMPTYSVPGLIDHH